MPQRRKRRIRKEPRGRLKKNGREPEGRGKESRWFKWWVFFNNQFFFGLAFSPSRPATGDRPSPSAPSGKTWGVGQSDIAPIPGITERSTGGGTAVKDQEMPPVARAYLSQIYLPRHPEDTIGLRNLRELRTLTTLVDMIAQNDLLRALDVAVQRIKSIELFVAQGQWGQANLIELIVPEEEQRAWFRQELKAAQQEQRSDLRLQQDQWPRRRQAWGPSHAAVGGAEKKEGDTKNDTPPSNGGSPGKGKKGRCKGKKGRGKWWMKMLRPMSWAIGH